MPSLPKKPEQLALGLAALALAGAGAFAAYGYHMFYSLERRVDTLSAALANAGALDIASTTGSQDEALTSVVAKTAPAVVSVVISKDVPKLQIQYENPFGGDSRYRGFTIRIPVYRQIGTQQEQIGAGTGFIVRQDGYIVTNRHVVDDKTAQYTVLLSDGRQKTASVVYLDQTNDIAIIKIDGSGYPTVELGDSSNLQLGQTVAAIGNALGEYSNSVSVGIVSGLNRTVEAFDEQAGRQEKLTDVIQTDAAINLGNSGGPLLDLTGRAVGMSVVTAVGANSIAFAIPVNDIKTIIAQALKGS